MRNTQKQVIEAFQRVQDFLRDNPLPSGEEYGPGQTLLGQVLGTLASHRRDQMSGGREGQAERDREGALRRSLREMHLRPISLIARASMREKPGIQKALRMPRPQFTTLKLVADAEGIRDAVAPYEAEFVALGRPADFLAQLDQAIAKLEGSLRGKATFLGRRVGASEGMADEVKRGREALKLLDAKVSTAFAGRADVLGKWRTAKRIRALPSGGVVVTGGTADENLEAA